MDSSKRGSTLHSISKRALATIAGLTLVLAACGSSSKSGSGGTGGSSGGSVTLNGSGSTFQKTFDQAAIKAFQSANSGTTINYAGGGSGKGKTDLQTQTVDFAGTDSLIKPADTSKYQGGKVLYFPLVAAPITVSYHVSGLNSLQLSPDTLAKIFDGQITKWNDSAIAADNSGASLPDTTIVIAHRADGSGTTNNFTKYLTLAATSSWTLGTGDTVNWPSNSQAGQGNAGVAQIVSQTDGAVGYVDLADAKNANLKFASIKNSSGSFIAPTLDAAAAAVASANISTDLTYSPLNASGATAYPITSPTWIIVYEKQTSASKGSAIKKFLQYVLTDGQALANANNYAPLPTDLAHRSVLQLERLQIPS
jgi:phosphate transport system substrate-binding protein